MNAYTYFKNLSLSVEPDMLVEAAGEKEESAKDTEEIIVSKDALTVSETENPIDTLNNILSDTSDSEEITVSNDGNVIALIDTGVGESANVIDRVSVIEEPETSTEHGDAMLQAIVSQNPDANILSIRAMNSNGFGTISSLVAAMEYAISENVDMINLSLYARTTLSTSVLKSEIQKAVDAGITVIGAAGNDGVDVMDYVPGSVESAYIIGAAKEDGSRLETSNFGATVDYHVVAESTSEATALFTGYVSKNGLDSVASVLNQGMIYETGFGGLEEDTEDFVSVGDVQFYTKMPEKGGKIQVLMESDIVDTGLSGIIFPKKEGYASKIQIASGSSLKVELIADKGYRIVSGRVMTKEGEELIVFKDCAGQDSYSYDMSVPNEDFVIETIFERTDEPLSQEAKEYQELLDTSYHEVLPDTDAYFQNAEVSARKAVRLTTGRKIPYPTGTYSTHEFYVDGGVGLAYCSEPKKYAPSSGTYNSVKIDDASYAKVWKYLMLTNIGMELQGDGDNLWGASSSKDKRTVYIHATIGNIKTGVWTGLNQDEIQGIQAVKNQAQINVNSGNYDSILKKYVLYNIPIGGIYQDMVYITPPEKGGLSIQKQSKDTTITNGNSNYSLKGAQYGIWNNASCSGNSLLTITTDDKGYAKTADDALDVGTYYVKETKASPGYALDPNTYTYTVVGGQTSIQNRKTSSEPPKTGEGELEKKSDNPAMTDGNNCYSLAGAVYGVWKDSSCSGTPWKRMTTDAKGHAKVDKLPFGNYWVKEITPSKGFELDTNVYPISVTEANPKATIRSVEPAGNDPMVITINKIWNGPETPTVPSLAGTQFTVWYYDNLNKNVSGTPKKTWVLEVKQRPNGKWVCGLQDEYLVKEKSDDFYRDPDTKKPVLPYGTYKIQETQHAPGYTFEGTMTNFDGTVSLSTTDAYITVVDKDTTGGIHLIGGNEYTGHNKPHDTSIKIRKVDENGRPLAGVKFTLKNSKGELVSTKTSGADGYVTWDKLYPDIYTVTEIETVDGKNLLADDIEIHLPMRITEEDIKKYNIDRDKLSEWDKAEQCYYLFDVTYEISNSATFKAPSTGGFTDFMTFLPLVGGMAGLTGVGAVAMKRKRKKKGE